MMRAAGVDGCRGGWICVLYDGRRVECRLHRDVTLAEELSGAALAFIDIPIGLPGPGERREVSSRACDHEARSFLRRAGSRSGSSVFPVPVRDAVYAPDYLTACARNSEATGRKLSVQSWNIVPKIRAVDELIRERPGLISTVYESHPEICFAVLAGRRAPFASKKSRTGRAERLALIRELFPDAANAVEGTAADMRSGGEARSTGARAGMDDLLDAAVLAVSAFLCLSGRRAITLVPDRPELDRYGIPARIAFPGNVAE